MKYARSPLKRLAPVALACLALGATGAASAAPVTWIGANGSFWDLAGNWNPGLPGLLDDVGLGASESVFRSGTVGVKSFTGTGAGKLTLTGGTLRTTATSAIGTLAMSGGTLSGVGTVNATTLAFTSGTMGESGQGGGVTNVSGASTFEGANNQAIYYGRALNLNGNSTWTIGTSNAIYIFSGGQGTSSLNVAAGKTFADAGNTAANQTRYLGWYGDGVFGNAGTYNRNGVGTTQVNTVFNNAATGTVNVNAGAMNMLGGGTSSGALKTTAGAVLGIGGGIYNLSGGSLVNNGTTQVTGGVLRNQSALNITGTGTFSLAGGTLGGTGTLGIGSAFSFSGGTMGETGQAGAITNVTGLTTFAGTASQYLYYGRILNLRNDSTWTVGTGSIYIYSGGQGTSTLVNASGNLFSDLGTTAANQTRHLGYYGDGLFQNAGTYTRTGLGATEIGPLLNTGRINANGGTVVLGGGGSNKGILSVASGATMSVGGGTLLQKAGAITSNGVFQVSSGTLRIVNPITTTGSGSFNLAGGVLGGPGDLTIGNAFNFSGGTLGENGRRDGITTVTGLTTFTGTGSQYIYYGATLNLAGNANWTTGTGAIYMSASNQGATTLNIGAGSTFTDAGTTAANQVRYLGYYADANINNSGTLNRNGLGTTQVGSRFNNLGTVNVNAGTLRLEGAGSSEAGSVYNVGAGGVLQFNGGSHFLNAGTINNAGNVLVSSGYVMMMPSLALAGTGQLQVGGGYLRVMGDVNNPTGSLRMTGGYLSGPGNLTVGTLTFTDGIMGESGWGGGTTTVTGAATFDGATSPQIYYGRTLQLNGGATWAAGAGLIYIYTGGQGRSALNIASGTTFADGGTAAANQVRRLGYYGDGVVNNAGTYARSGLGTTQVDAQFVNTGTLQANGGTISLTGGGSNTGTMNVAAGGVLGFGGDNYYFNGGTLNNNGIVQVTAGALTVLPGANFTGNGSLQISGGYLRTLGNLTNGGGPLTMTGGVLSGPGTINVAALNFTTGTMGETNWGGGTTNVSGLATFDGTTSQYIYYGRTLQLNGDANWTAGAGAIQISSGNQGNAQVNTAAGKTFTDAGTTTSNQTRYLGYHADGTVNNAGTYVRNGLGTTQVNALFNNSGSVVVNGGTMSFVNGAIQGTGTLQINAAGSVKLLSGDSTVGKLVHNGVAGSLDIGANQIAISKDYTNDNWGFGNSFNRLANITFTGTGEHIVAAGNVAQAVGGALVTNGTGDTPTLTIGNVHVGGYAVAYQIQNTGTTGPSLRGAVQSNVNGANITDARLTGVAKNWGPVATGGSQTNSFLFTVATEGVYTALAANQKMNILNNFENTNSQLVNIKSAAGAAAYNLAAPTLAPASVAFAAQRVGGTASQAITVGNAAPVSAYSEVLDVAFGTMTGSATNNAGTVSLLAPGASNNTALRVGLDTSTAGAKTGSAALAFTSNGTGTSGLGLTALASQSVAVSGDVYAPAIAKVNTGTVNFGIVHVGDVVNKKSVSVKNDAAVVAGFNDVLRGTISDTSATFNSTGSLAGVAAGATNTTFKVALVTTTAGLFNSTATMDFSSRNGAMADLALGSATVNLKAQVNNYAVAAFSKTAGSGTFSGAGNSFTLDFGTLVTGATALTANMAVLNAATGLADVLGGSFITTGIGTGDNFTLAGFNGSFSSIAAGSSYAGLSITFGSGILGAFDKTLTLQSTGSNSSGYNGALANVQLRLLGTVAAAAPVIGGGGSSLDIGGGTLAPVAAVPEPGTYLMMVQGLLAFALLRRRQARRRAAA